MTWNNFGATSAQVTDLYQGTTLDDFGDDGEASALAALSRAADQIVNALPENVYKAVAFPELVYLVKRASEGSTAFQVPIGKPKAGTFRLWVGHPIQFEKRPQQLYGVRLGTQEDTLFNVQDDKYTLNGTTGVGAYLPGFRVEQQAIASYEVDTEDVGFSLPSLARLATRGAAAELGEKLYAESDTEGWIQVAKYRDAFLKEIEDISLGKLVPPEIRVLQFWAEVVPIAGSGARGGSVQLWRSA
jgi:hypothetical protein